MSPQCVPCCPGSSQHRSRVPCEPGLAAPGPPLGTRSGQTQSSRCHAGGGGTGRQGRVQPAGAGCVPAGRGREARLLGQRPEPGAPGKTAAPTGRPQTPALPAPRLRTRPELPSQVVLVPRYSFDLPLSCSGSNLCHFVKMTDTSVSFPADYLLITHQFLNQLPFLSLS